MVDRQLLLMLRVPPPHFRPEASYGGGYRDAPGRDARRRIARSLARAHGLRLLDDWPMPALGLDCFVMEAPSADVPCAAARATGRRSAGGIGRADADVPRACRRLAAGGDPLAATQPAMADWHLRELHKLATGRHVTIAALDTGVDATHPDLRGQRLQTRNFIDGNAYAAETHGTAVAGIIAARADDGIGIAGIAPGARLLGLRACSQLARGGAACSSFSLAKALQFALEAKAQVFNLSLTGPPDRLLGRLLDVALARGVSVVGAVDIACRRWRFPGVASRRAGGGRHRNRSAGALRRARSARTRSRHSGTTARRRLGPGIGHVVRRRAGQRTGRAAAGTVAAPWRGRPARCAVAPLPHRPRWPRRRLG